MKRLLALFLLLALAAGYEVLQRSGAASYPDDRANVDLSIAAGLAGGSTYGVAAGAPIFAERDVLWHGMLSLGASRNGVRPEYAAALTVGLLWVLLILLFSWHAGFPGARWRVSAVLALCCVTPAWVMASISGGTELLGAALILSAAVLHSRGCYQPGGLLPVGAAAMIGLACWLRVEYALWWLVFALHAVVIIGIRKAWRRFGVWLVLRILIGVVLIAIILAPLLALNMRAGGIPWPRAADALLGTAPDIGQALLRSFTQWRMIWAGVFDPGSLGGGAALFVFLAGVCSAWMRVKRRESDPDVLLAPLAIILLPAGRLLLAPWLGCAGSMALGLSLVIVCLPTLIEGCWYLAKSLITGLRRMGLREDGWFNPTRAAVVLAVVVMGLNGFDAGTAARRSVETARSMGMERQAAADALVARSRPRQPLIVATPEPGWLLRLAPTSSVVTIDMTGYLNREWRLARRPDGTWDAVHAREALKKSGAGYLVLPATEAAGEWPNTEIVTMPTNVVSYRAYRIK